jgi:hypothetical protein
MEPTYIPAVGDKVRCIKALSEPDPHLPWGTVGEVYDVVDVMTTKAGTKMRLSGLAGGKWINRHRFELVVVEDPPWIPEGWVPALYDDLVVGDILRGQGPNWKRTYRVKSIRTHNIMVEHDTGTGVFKYTTPRKDVADSFCQPASRTRAPSPPAAVNHYADDPLFGSW